MKPVIPPTKATPTQRQACWTIYGQAKRSGHLTPPDICEHCRRKGQVDGHHPDYAYPLTVMWLCPACHSNEHTRIGRVRGPAAPRNRSPKVGRLTGRQNDILAFMRQCVRENGYPPTVREIGTHFGIKSPNGVMCHLDALIRKGEVEFTPNISRGYVPIQKRRLAKEAVA